MRFFLYFILKIRKKNFVKCFIVNFKLCKKREIFYLGSKFCLKKVMFKAKLKSFSNSIFKNFNILSILNARVYYERDEIII